MANRKPIFFTSDWHVGSANTIRYSNRPFSDIDEMERKLINNYNACVTDKGVCYFLGDFGFCSHQKIREVLEQLNGTKVLILGNHDKKMHSMYNAGFDVVLNWGMIMIGKEIVTFSHCPLPGIQRENTEGMTGAAPGEHWHGESRETHKGFIVPNSGQFHLHGHCHATNSGKSKVKLSRQWDVGVDGNQYRPVSISQVESWISKTKELEK